MPLWPTWTLAMSRPSRPTLHLFPRRILRALPLTAAVTCLLGSSPLLADGVTIAGASPAQSLDINVDKASISAVLQALHEKYGIEVIDNGAELSSEQISLTLTGSLPSILERLLRNQNYMIVRSQKNATGVERILISATSPPGAPKSVPAKEEPPPMP